MNYRTYASRCNKYKNDLIVLLSADDVKYLAACLQKISVDSYIDWRCENSSIIDDFLISTNQQRRQRKYKNLAREDYFLLVLASIQKAESARCFLRACDDAFLEKAHPYESMCLLAGQAGFQFFEENPLPPLYWPFPNVCNSPFKPS